MVVFVAVVAVVVGAVVVVVLVVVVVVVVVVVAVVVVAGVVVMVVAWSSSPQLLGITLFDRIVREPTEYFCCLNLFDNIILLRTVWTIVCKQIFAVANQLSFPQCLGNHNNLISETEFVTLRVTITT